MIEITEMPTASISLPDRIRFALELGLLVWVKSVDEHAAAVTTARSRADKEAANSALKKAIGSHLGSVAGAKAWMQSRGKWVPNTGAANIAAVVMR